MKITKRRIGKEKHLLDCLYEGLQKDDKETKLAMLNFFFEDTGTKIHWHPGYPWNIKDTDKMIKVGEAAFLEKRDKAIKFLKKINKWKD